MLLECESPTDNGLLLAGMPFGRAAMQREEGIELVAEDGSPLPVWWTVRSCWPDGSVKWLWLHARVPKGHSQLELRTAATGGPTSDADIRITPGRAELRAGHVRLEAGPTGFLLEAEAERLNVVDEPDILDPPLASDLNAASFEVVEPSSIAPMIRMRHPVSEGWRRECLFRIDPLHGVVYWTRRVTLLSGPRHDLRRMHAVLTLSAGEWQGVGSEGAHAVYVPAPHRMRVDDGPEAAGNPEAILRASSAGAWIENGWQRAPFALQVDGPKAVVEFYPQDARPLPVLQGTSFRHEVRLAIGPTAAEAVTATVRWRWDSEAACTSGVLGPLAPRNDEVKRLFTGFDTAFEAGIAHCRSTRLDKPGSEEPPGPPADLADETTHDEEFFGLQHYGDWPMAIGAYGGTKRMYCDNEYDVSYALFQHFARTGRWEILELARHSAMHMTDVDFMAHTGDLRFHGYVDEAEDHETSRTPHGDLGHAWTDGFWCLHFILGDPFARESALALSRTVVGQFAGDEDGIRQHFTGCERAVGWAMVAISGAAEVEPLPEVLETLERMCRYVAKYMRDPDAEFEGVETIGGRPALWWRCAAQDGSKPFMLGVLMEGLERYHRLSGSAAAGEALVAIARFLRDVMWCPTAGAFLYEFNAYQRRHRDIYPNHINLLVTRGVAYAYEISGDESFRTLTQEAAYGGLWTAFETTGGKEIGMIGRTSGATVAYMHEWWRRDQAALAGASPLSDGAPFAFNGSPEALLESPCLTLRKGLPRFEEQGALVCDDTSLAVCDLDTAWHSDEGRVAVEFSPSSDVTWDGAGNPRPGWALLHLCDRRFTASAIAVMHFYDSLHVRFYDAHRKLIEVLETSIVGWPAGEKRRIEFQWNPGEAILLLDGQERHRVPMGRQLSGRFRRIYLGCKPGNWRGKGVLHHVELELGPRT